MYRTEAAEQRQTDQHAHYVASQSKVADRVGIVLAILALYIIWGSTYLAMRITLESVPAFMMAGIRFTVAGIVLYSFLRLRHAPSPTRSQWLGAALVGILLIGFGNGCVSFAEQWVASGLAAVAMSTVPLWAAFFFGFLGRWPKRWEWLGLALGFVGVVLLNFEHGIWASPTGAIMLLLAPLGWALGSALSSRVSLPDGLMASAAQMLVGGVILLATSLLTGERLHSMPTWNSLAALSYLIIFGSLIAYSAYGYLLRRVRPALATSYAYVNPVVAVGLGIGLAGEHITLLGIGAMLVILAGVGLVALGRSRNNA
jgi:drug/metabolite transporter (DMT)-like permease